MLTSLPSHCLALSLCLNFVSPLLISTLLLINALTTQPQPINYTGISLPHEASSTLYIEGLPPDATEREVSHIFRRYEGHGFQSIRLRPIESNKNPGTNLVLCFAEFDNAHQATVALYGLQVVCTISVTNALRVA